MWTIIKKICPSFTQIGKSILWCAIVIWSLPTSAQVDTLTFHQGLEFAEKNFPIMDKNIYYEQITKLEMRNVSSSFLPQLSLLGQASYQSEVVEIPFTAPGMEKEDLPHTRGQVYLQMDQLIYDGGVSRTNKLLQKDKLNINKTQVEVDLHQLKTKINQLYFSILMNQKRNAILQSTIKVLNEKKNMMQSQLSSGVLMASEVLKLEAEILKFEQQIVQLQRSIQSQLEVLGFLLGVDLKEGTILRSPNLKEGLHNSMQLKRPELKLLNLQSESIENSIKLTSTANKPKFSAFAQGGLGYPNPYNFFDNNASTYWQIGVRMNWKLWDWNNTRREKEILNIQSDILETNIENLERNIKTNLFNLEGELNKLDEIIEKDQQIVAKRDTIAKLASEQLDAGVILSTEYLDHITSFQQAQINLELNRINKIYQQVKYALECGNLEELLVNIKK